LLREPGGEPCERPYALAVSDIRVSTRPDRGKEFSMETPEPEELLTPSEVAAMFRVNPKTVTRWARAGRISYIKTLGGHRRFKASEIRRLLEEAEESADT
jgi:excisionase family DNA binding protein